MEYLLHILVIAGIYVILTLSLNLVVGYAGLAALGHAAFSCVGAYASALLALNVGVSPWFGLPAGAFTAALLGAVVGIPAIIDSPPEAAVLREIVCRKRFSSGDKCVLREEDL